MVKIAVAGGTGEVAREIISVLAAANKHEIIALSRKEPTPEDKAFPGVTWLRVNYEDKDELVQVLRGVDTVLSFVQVLQDVGNTAQRNLIDASVLAGVRRFAPSEWASRVALDFWSGKEEIRNYLRQLNEKEKVLEYCLFQPGLFLNYLATPHKTMEYVKPLSTHVDLENRRAIAVEGHDAIVSLTTVQDLAAVVARAVDFEGEWPVVGGIRGCHLAMSEIIKSGEAIRGGPFKIDTVKLEDLEAGKFTASWTLQVRHASLSQMSEAEAIAMTNRAIMAILHSSATGAWDVSDEWNQLLPDYKFTGVEDFLRGVWEGKP